MFKGKVFIKDWKFYYFSGLIAAKMLNVFFTIDVLFFYHGLVATTGVPDLPFPGGSHRPKT